MEREALKLALEALKTCYEDGWNSEYAFGLAKTYDENKVAQAIAAIEEALAQPAQEPVAWMNPSWIDPDTRGWQSDSFESIPIEGWLPLYTTSAQRTWVGLTDDEAQWLYDTCRTPSNLIDMVEAKLKDKNNG